MPASPRLVLSEATASDFERVYEFIESQRSPHLVMHSQKNQAAAAAAGLLFKILDDQQEIVATALVVPVGKTPYHEMGNCFVSEPWRGFRIQHALILVRAAALVVAESASQRLVTAVDPTNTRSLTRVTKAGFKPLTVRVPELFHHCENCEKKPLLPPERECCCDFFMLDEDTHRTLVRELLALGPTMTLTNREGKQVTLELNCKCVTDPHQRRVLSDFARETAE